MNDLIKKAEELVNMFSHLDIFRRYLMMKNELENDAYILKLKEDIKKIKNNLHLLKADQRKIYLTLLKKMEEEYNSYPLMCNFNSLKKQLQDMVLPFTQFEF